MDITISVASAAKQAALTKAAQAYNASSTQPLSQSEFMRRLIDGQLEGLVKAYLITQITKLAFLNRFEPEERIAIRAAAAQSPAIHDYLEMLDAAQDVDLTDPRTIGGVQALEAAGLLGEGRGAEILAL